MQNLILGGAIDEENNGAELAAAVIAIMRRRFPSVEIGSLPRSIEGKRRHMIEYHGTVVTFTTSEPRAARLVLLANYDWSYSLHSGRFILLEDEPTTGTKTERIEQVANQIGLVAREGVRRTWLDRLISLGRDRVEPWS